MIKLLAIFASIFKLTKFSKALFSGFTIIITIISYTWIYGFPFALGFVALIFFHEMGHYLAAKEKGLNVGLPTFIPFLGAWIELKEQPMNVADEAYIAFAGPFTGTIAAFVFYYYGRIYDSQLAIALAHSGFFLNLFNLIPFHPLDGGRIIAILSPMFWFFGCPLLLIMWYYTSSPLLLLIAILGIPSLKEAWEMFNNPNLRRNYYSVSTEAKFEYGSLYLLLIVVLSYMLYYIK